MSATGNEFRTAIFGGFHKADVLTYIEKTAQAHIQQLAQAQKAQDASEKAAAAAGEQVAAAAIVQGELEQENQRLEEALATSAQALEETRQALEKAHQAQEGSRQALEGAKGELAGVHQQLEQLQARVKKLEPAAAAYESVKDRTAGIELEAHHRANVVEGQAEEQVRQARQALEQWLREVQAGYDRLRTDLDATISHASGELDRVGKSLRGMAGEFDDRDADLEALVETFRGLPGPKAPQPLPLEEA